MRRRIRRSIPWSLPGRIPWPASRRLGVVGGVLVTLGVVYAGTRIASVVPRLPEPPPEASSLPVFPPMPEAFDGLSLAARMAPPVLTWSDLQGDELLRSPVLADPEFARAVHWWVDYWRGPARRWFPGFLDRMAWRGSTVDTALASRGLPPSLRYLPLIESGYDAGVTSRAAAVGLWQLMPGTARDLGLRITPLLDERRHPAKSTVAALTYLTELRESFDSWFLALAAYNSGPARVRGILRRHAPGVAHSDSLYWALRAHFPAETREFVPKLFGAMWVASRPEAYGYEAPPLRAYVFDEVEVPNRTTLDVVAEAAGVPHDEIRVLNPEWVLGITPPSTGVTLRLPRGTATRFAMNYAALPWGGRITFPEHVVGEGETFSQIAARYGVRVDDIQAVNGHVDPHSLRSGARLRVPVGPSVDGS